MVAKSVRERVEYSTLVKSWKMAGTSTLQNKDACRKELNFVVCMCSFCNIEERRPKSICVSVNFKKEHKLRAGRLPGSWNGMCVVWKMNKSHFSNKVLESYWRAGKGWQQTVWNNVGEQLSFEAQWQGRGL